MYWGWIFLDIKEMSEKEKEILISKYGKLNIQEEENPYRRFTVGVLDRFNKPLNIKEADDLLISFDPTDKGTQRNFFEQEAKFLTFFKVAYGMNGKKPVYVYCPDFFTLKSKAYSSMINTFNDRDKQLLKILLKNNDLKNGAFIVENEELLKLFAKLSLREICFSNFFFDNSSTIIIGNYELSFPIYCLHEFLMKSYERVATEIGLFIRK